jgi:hypothetical protein
MKLKNISKYVLAATLVVSSTTGCSSFLDVNKSPNSPERVPVSTMLPAAIYAMAFANNNEINRLCEVLTHHLAGMANSPLAYENYSISGFDNQWDGELYQGALTTAERLIEESKRVNSPAYAGIAKIIKAYCFAMVTDLWGDVPYSQALNGMNGIIQPKVDKQEDIYKGNSAANVQSLFDLLREAVKNLDEKSDLVPSASDDPIYRGSLANWKRAANTLMLKFALQISSKEPALATSVINEVLQGNNYITDNSQNFAVRFGTAVGSMAPFYQYTAEAFGNLFRNDMVMSRRVLDVMRGQNDPRLPLFFTRPGADYVTSENGLFNAPAPASNWSRYNTAITGGGAGPVRLVTNSQRAFILAEAVIRLKIAGDAQALYREGIRASMLDAGVTQAQIDAFFTANPSVANLSTGTDAQKIEQIITQKWISLVGNGYESYNDWRRTGFPVLPESPNPTGSVDGKRPRRIPYTNNEISRNPNLIPAGSTPPQTNVRVWWDTN